MKRLYPNCIPVVGFSNIALCDLDRQQFHTISKNDFFEKMQLVVKPEETLPDMSEKAIAFLSEKKLLIKDKRISEDRSIQTSQFYKWKSPSLITNAIIVLSTENKLIVPLNFNKLIHYLEQLNCKHVCFIIQTNIALDDLRKLFDQVRTSHIQAVQLFLPYQESFYSDAFGELIMFLPFIQFVILEESPFDKNFENKIFFTKNKFAGKSRKTREQFVTNHFLFSESQLHHTYFNRKLFIDKNGKIKNAPECAEEFGHIQDIEHPEQLIERIKTQAFQKYWYVTKERIEICMDCEFRHICVDNRIPHQRENGYWYHTEACNYDPYTGSWKNGE